MYLSCLGNECGQLGHSPKQVSKVLPRVVEFRWNGKAGSNTSHILQNVACGDLFTLFLTASGEVFKCFNIYVLILMC